MTSDVMTLCWNTCLLRAAGAAAEQQQGARQKPDSLPLASIFPLMLRRCDASLCVKRHSDTPSRINLSSAPAAWCSSSLLSEGGGLKSCQKRLQLAAVRQGRLIAEQSGLLRSSGRVSSRVNNIDHLAFLMKQGKNINIVGLCHAMIDNWASVLPRPPPGPPPAPPWLPPHPATGRVGHEVIRGTTHPLYPEDWAWDHQFRAAIPPPGLGMEFWIKDQSGWNTQVLETAAQMFRPLLNPSDVSDRAKEGSGSCALPAPGLNFRYAVARQSRSDTLEDSSRGRGRKRQIVNQSFGFPAAESCCKGAEQGLPQSRRGPDTSQGPGLPRRLGVALSRSATGGGLDPSPELRFSELCCSCGRPMLILGQAGVSKRTAHWRGRGKACS